MGKSLIVYFLFSVSGNLKSEWLYVPSKETADKEIKQYLDFAFEDYEECEIKVLNKTFCTD